MEETIEPKENFFKHVFNFDDETKAEVLNNIQFALLAIIPVTILSKSIKKFVPDADDQKGSLEICAEIIIQVIVTFISFMIIGRIITYIPTYSQKNYIKFHAIYSIIPFLMISISLQTKIGEKITILINRLNDLWNGTTDNKKNKKGSSVKVSQPISGQITGQMMNNAAANQALYSTGTAISSLPMVDSQNTTMTQSQQLPNYNEMYKQDTTPLVNAASPGQTENMAMMEPMAANSVLGGGFGSSW
jgi:uncharacterized membrane protein